MQTLKQTEVNHTKFTTKIHEGKASLLIVLVLFQMFGLCFAQSKNTKINILKTKYRTTEGWIKSNSGRFPLEAVKVTDPVNKIITYTDKAGHFTLNLPSDQDGNLVAELVGYAPGIIKYEQGQLIPGRTIAWLNRNTKGIPKLVIGDSIPEELWRMILPIENDKNGRTKIILEEYRKSPVLVLDFWSKSCGPCINALDKWQILGRSLEKEISVISAYVGFPESVEPFMTERKWTMPVVVGEESEILNAYFFNQKQLGGMVIIVNGRFHSSPSIHDIDKGTLQKLVRGNIVHFTTEFPEFMHNGGW